MPQYIITYLGGEQPSSPEEGKTHFSKYLAWLESLGDAAVSPANPLKNTTTVNPDGSVTSGGKTTMSGFTLVDVESMEAAQSMAKACPFLEVGGYIPVVGMVAAGHDNKILNNDPGYRQVLGRAIELKNPADASWTLRKFPGFEFRTRSA